MARASSKAPQRGDLVWLDSTGQRSALVLSPLTYNRKVGLALVCPITSQVKGYPFEVELPAGRKTAGVVLADQVKSLDWRARNARVFGAVPATLVAEVLQLVRTLL